MSRPEKASERSMDEILASIRKIIAEEPIGSRGLGVDPGRAKPSASGSRPAGRDGGPAGGGALGALGDLLAEDRTASSAGMRPTAAQPGPSSAQPQTASAKWGMSRPAPAGPNVQRTTEPFLEPPAPAPAARSAPISIDGASSRSVEGGAQPPVEVAVGAAAREIVLPGKADLLPEPTRAPASSAPNAPKLSLIDALQSAVNDVQNESAGGGEARKPAPGQAAPGQAAAAPAAAAAPIIPSVAAPVSDFQVPPGAPVAPSAQVVMPAPRFTAPPAPAPVATPTPSAAFQALAGVLEQPPAPLPEPASVAASPKPVEPAAVVAREAVKAAPALEAKEDKPVPQSAPAPAPSAEFPRSTAGVAAAVQMAPQPVVPAAVAPAQAVPSVVPAPSPAIAAIEPTPGSKMTIIAPPQTPAQVRTMEDTVAELLRPMLREWLDAHMPRIVEKALRIEVAESLKNGVPPSRKN